MTLRGFLPTAAAFIWPRCCNGMSTVSRGWLRLVLVMLLPLGLGSSTVSVSLRASEAPRRLILVQGAAGTADYGREFETWLTRWQSAATSAGGWSVVTIGQARSDTDDRSQLQQAIQVAAKAAPAELWLVLIGHGSADRRGCQFHLRGPDLSVTDLKQWLTEIKCPTAVLVCASGSGPFLPELTGNDRVIVTATSTATELHFSRFGDFLSSALTETSTDLDKDGTMSLLELWLAAGRATADFYKDDGRVATEHSWLDDNGDGQGSRIEQFQGLDPAAGQPPPSDGIRAGSWRLAHSKKELNQPTVVRDRLRQLEVAIHQLRREKPTLNNEAYWAEMKPLLVEFARLSQSSSTSDGQAAPAAVDPSPTNPDSASP
jgi:hypothetical protein